MLRTLLVAFTLLTPGFATAEQFRDSAIGVAVVGDDGTEIGRVDAVERDEHGRIVAAELSGQEPADAPFAAADLVAESQSDLYVPVRDMRQQRNQSGGAQTRSR